VKKLKVGSPRPQACAERPLHPGGTRALREFSAVLKGSVPWLFAALLTGDIPLHPEGVKKLNDLGSPRPNEGEGLGVRGAMHAASSSKRG
jgi:hypothetical protein